MSDIPDFQLFAIALMVFGCYFAGFYFGKLSGRQRTEAKYKAQMKASAATRKRENPHL